MISRSQISSELVMSIVNRMATLVSETEKLQQHANNESTKTVLREALQRLALIKSNLVGMGKDRIFALVGSGNVGKSTLINALFGEDVSPYQNVPCTASPVQFYHSEQYEIRSYSESSVLGEKRIYESMECFRNALTENVSQPKSQGECTYVRAGLPSKFLSEGLIVVDTPGMGAALDSGGLSHENRTADYLRKLKATGHGRALMVVNATAGGISKRERELFVLLLKDICNDVLVTNSDAMQHDGKFTPEEIKARYRRRYAKTLEQSLIRFHFVSGTQARESQKIGNTELEIASGIPALSNYLRQALNNENIVPQTIAELLCLWDQLHDFLFDEIMGTSHSFHWKPTCLAWFFSKTNEAKLYEFNNTYEKHRSGVKEGL